MGDFDLGFTSLFYIFISLLQLSVQHLDTPDQSSYLSYPLLDFIYQWGGVLFSRDSSISRLHRAIRYFDTSTRQVLISRNYTFVKEPGDVGEEVDMDEFI